MEDKKIGLIKDLNHTTKTLDGIIMEIGKLSADLVLKPHDLNLKKTIDGKHVLLLRLEARKREIEEEIKRV
ncbi:MAG: hypothetical protein GQ574_29215 [Crocinitomix sp.]|nr:hypothetical protein [Crocinitomix sp.]